MQLSNICNWIISTSYFVGFIVIYVGTSELHFCRPHWIQKYLNPKNLSACAKPPYLILPPCIPSPYSVPPHAYPPPILSHPMHALPPILSRPCMPSPYSIPPLHALPLFYPTSCIPSPLFYPSPCIPCPLFYPSPWIPSPYSIPPHAYPPPILSQLIHTLPLFYSTLYMPSPYSIPTACMCLLFSTIPHMPPQYSIPAHACPPNSLSYEPERHVSPLTSENATFESAHTEYTIIIYLA